MNVLMLTTKYPGPECSEWLTSELAKELSSRNINVKVLNVEWSSKGYVGAFLFYHMSPPFIKLRQNLYFIGIN